MGSKHSRGVEEEEEEEEETTRRETRSQGKNKNKNKDKDKGRKRNGDGDDEQRDGRRGRGRGKRAREGRRAEYLGGEIQDRLGPATGRFDFATAYSVDVGRFPGNYEEAQLKLLDEMCKGEREGGGCDVSLDAISGGLDRERGEAASCSALGGGGTSSSTSLVQRVSEDEVILTVGIYHPEKPATVMQEVLVLGSQKLTDLKDKISCQRETIAKMHGVEAPSGFFFINGTFYDDLREEGSIRYSENILQFIEHKQEQGKEAVLTLARGSPKQQEERLERSGLNHKFTQRRMEDVTFDELEVKLGSGFPSYVYCHQGCCEHRIAFHDLRLAHKDDRALVSEYPRVVYQKFERRCKCMICGCDEGRHIVYDDKHALCSPCIMCEGCHQSLHLSEEGEKLYDGYRMYTYPMGVPKEA
ncbi:snRNA transcription factor [Chloropicon primus]|uniref:snRNA transcription factor n=1 Tax=Chloropicon primus TaxID=1764295 RepID=A0A5B8MGR1_9CHLO|nr:snRNA transcription factor [Chloropicon primus]UPQ97741.1 snRNA transcription factor [Chloropicon primus]|eukprot:QDZ18532.1 snRNA transcription factor [Chloropicon primus]